MPEQGPGQYAQWRIQTEHSKGKSTGKNETATDELQYLLPFNQSISQAMATNGTLVRLCFHIHSQPYPYRKGFLPSSLKT